MRRVVICSVLALVAEASLAGSVCKGDCVMGIFSDNFYSWLDRQHAAEKVAMDAAYKHPDGTECKAKKIENCPYYQKTVAKAEEIDDIANPNEVSSVESIATPSEMEEIKRGGLPKGQKFEAVKPSDLSTMADGSTNSRFRKMRNRLVKYVSDNQLGDGTYPLVDVTDEEMAKGLKPKFYDDGYMVSFQTTNGEGFNKKRKDLTMSDEDYDGLCEDLIAEGYGPHVGVFGGIPEISFKVDSKDVAERIMKKYNQVSLWDNAKGARAARAESEPGMSARKIKQLWNRAAIPNLEYRWKENQVTKAQ